MFLCHSSHGFLLRRGLRILMIGIGLGFTGLFCAAQAESPDAKDRMNDLTKQWPEKPVVCIENFFNLYNPHIVRDERDKVYPYRMWFFGWSVRESNQDMNVKSDAIFLARSKDLKKWEVYTSTGDWDATMNPKLWFPVIYADDHPKYDSMGNGDPSVVLKNGVYYMVFSSIGFDLQHQGSKTRVFVVNNVMAATSADGIRWKKSARPILIWPDEYKNRWELIPGQGISDPPKDYHGSYHRPSLMFDEGKWKVWFDYFLPGTFVSMGYAECSGDFINQDSWKVLRAGTKPLLKDWPNPDVIKVGKIYYSFCDSPYYPDSLGGDTRQIIMAQSRDGLNWQVLGHIRPEGMASSHVPEAFVQKEGSDTWIYLFYSWKPAYVEGTKRDFNYKQIRFIRHKLTPKEMGE